MVERKLENFKVGHGYRLRARAVGRVIAPGNRADSLLPSDSHPCISFSYSISFFNSHRNTKVILHFYSCRRYVDFHTKLTGLSKVLILLTLTNTTTYYINYLLLIPLVGHIRYNQGRAIFLLLHYRLRFAYTLHTTSFNTIITLKTIILFLF